MLLLLAPLSIYISFSTTPPHMIPIFRSMNNTTPIIIFLLKIVLATINTKFGIYISNFLSFCLLNFKFQAISFLCYFIKHEFKLSLFDFSSLFNFLCFSRLLLNHNHLLSKNIAVSCFFNF